MKLSLCLLLLTVLAPALAYAYSRPVLRVTVRHAYGLRGDGWFGRTDGYVKVIAGRITRQTRTIWNDNSPTWWETLTFPPLRWAPSLRLQVWDSDRGWFGGRDDYLGGCIIRIVRGRWSRSQSCRLGRGRVYFTYTYPRDLSRSLEVANSTVPVPTDTSTPVTVMHT